MADATHLVKAPFLATVILPTLNRESYLLQVLEDLLDQTCKNFKIMIVDQSDTKSEKVSTVALAHSNRVFYHHVQFRGLPLARNYGFQNTETDFLIFLDDDVRCSRQLVEQHLQPFVDPQIGLVAGGIDEANKKEDPNPLAVGTFSYWTATPKRGFQSKIPTDVLHAPGGNFSVRRKIFSEVGGFDEAFNRGAALYEETDFCLRVLNRGYRIYFNPKARLTHLAAATGGCRVPQLAPYLRSLSRNRVMIIYRYLKWYQIPVAILRLLALNLSYVRSQRDPGALLAGLRGIWEGLSERKKPQLVTHYR